MTDTADTDFVAIATRVLDVESRAIRDLVARIDSSFNDACSLCLQTDGRVKIMDFVVGKLNFKASAYQFQDNMLGLTEPRLKTNDYEILESLYLENRLINFIAGSIYLEQRYAALDRKIVQIVHQIDKLKESK